jgi:hypothetical protein
MKLLDMPVKAEMFLSDFMFQLPAAVGRNNQRALHPTGFAEASKTEP